MGRSYKSRNSNSKAVHIHHEVTYIKQPQYSYKAVFMQLLTVFIKLNYLGKSDVGYIDYLLYLFILFTS